MCGRFTWTTPPELMWSILENFKNPMDFQPRYNIAPTQDVPVIPNTISEFESDTDTRKLEFFKWGLIPSWAKDAKNRK